MTLDPPVVWRVASLAEMRGCCPDSGAGWLAPNERGALAALRDGSRRDAWLGARVLAKQLILEHVAAPVCRPEQIEIVSRDAFGRGVRPQVTIAGRAVPWSLSISHTEAMAAAALSTAPGVRVGVDLVRGGPLTPAFLRAWFDGTEQALAAAGDGLEACRVWAIKEAVYKAVNLDDPFAPRQVRVRRAPRGGYQCTYRGIDLTGCCRIEVRVCGDHVAALATVSRQGPAKQHLSHCRLSLRESRVLSRSERRHLFPRRSQAVPRAPVVPALEPGYAEPGNAEPGNAEPGNAESGSGEPGNA